MNIYWMIVAAVIAFGIFMPQTGRNRKYYVMLIGAVHTFVCAFRYQYLTGDLIKYHTEYRHMMQRDYFSEKAINEWKNTGFYWLMKFVGDLTNGDYQAFLIILAVITCTIAAVLIYRYSPRPWLSFLVWNCMNLYLLYDFLAIKQGLAMAILMLSMMCIFEKKPLWFLICTLAAGFIHMPALAFLPAYFLANRRISGRLILVYIISAVVIFIMREQIVEIIGEIYYEEASFTLIKEELGGKVIVIVMILMAGMMLRGFREERFSQLFNLIVAAAILQMFSGFSNIFTRLADYYLQFTILFIPAIFYGMPNTRVRVNAAPAVFDFNRRSIRMIVIMLTLVLIWWYDTTCLGVPVDNEIDNYLNFRFMWD